MNNLKLFEDFDKLPYYMFDVREFFENFKIIFYKCYKECHDYTSDFFYYIHMIVKDWNDLPLNKISENVISYILADKTVEFYNLAGDIEFDRVKNTIIKTNVYSECSSTSTIKNLFDFKFVLYDEKIPIDVDYNKPIKIYSKKTKIEDMVEILISSNKYNI